ncbi:hypothetical protein niasHS_003372 [Heterodera schachtii]|uniref:Cation/H+ exchanger transmembrane domain-containing protein n=1 Tax=Heterodera schachtii TaxID=97005 RepID=A0ABD2KGU7_HETSC
MPLFLLGKLSRIVSNKQINLVLTSLFVLLSLYGTLVALFARPFISPLIVVNSSIASPNSPNLTLFSTDEQVPDQLVRSLFSLFVLWASALCVGHLFRLAHLPPLFGMLLVGIAFNNISPLRSSLLIRPSWDEFLRKSAFVLILLRCAVGLDHETLRRSFSFCASFGILSTISEVSAIVCVAHFLFKISLANSVLFGFVLASTSPAVTVPTMIQFQRKRIGTQKGIPTLALASASVDNIFSISAFSIAFSIFSAPSGQSLLTLSLFACIQLLAAFAFGFLSAVKFDVSGPIAVFIASLVAAVRWKKDNAKKAFRVADSLRLCWDLFFLPLLFVLIGLLFDLSDFTLPLFQNAVTVIAFGIVCRFLSAFLLSLFNDQIHWRERLFFSTIFLPKATVQAALSPMLFHFAEKHSPIFPNSKDGTIPPHHFLLQTCILSILLTAPIGQIIIQIAGKTFLAKDEKADELASVKMGKCQRETQTKAKLNSLFCLLFGVPLNSLLIWLLLRRTSNEMRAFSQLLVQTCVVDLLVLVLAALVLPVFFVENGIGFDVMAGPLQSLPNPANHFVFMLWFGLFYFSIEGIAVQFIYRYLTICRKVPMDIPKYFGLLSVALLFEFSVAAALSISCYPSTDAQLQRFCYPKNSVLALTPGKQRDGGGRHKLPLPLALRCDPSDPFVAGSFLFLLFSDIFLYATIIICALKIHAYLRRQFVEYKLSKWSELNGQITKTLLIQSLLPSVPLLMCTLGISATLFAPSAGTLLISAEMLITVPLCWLPVANPLVTIATVKHFRKEFRSVGRRVLSLMATRAHSEDEKQQKNAAAPIARHGTIRK